MTTEQDRLLHELQIHQVELEVQNRELRESQSALEASRARYVDLYDFSPIAYFTLDPMGVVLEVNLTGAALVGRDRSQIVGKPFLAAVRMADSTSFWAHLRRCSREPSPVVSELSLSTSHDRPLEVSAVSIPIIDPQSLRLGFRTALTDISARKKADAEREHALQSERAIGSQLERLDRAGIAISHAMAVHTGLDPSPILQVIVDQARIVLTAASAAIGTLGPTSDHPFELWITSGISSEVAREIGRPPGARGLLGVIVQNGQVVRVGTPRQHPAFAGYPEHHPEIGSFLGAPVRYGDTVRGCLHVANKTDGAEFSEIDQHCIEMLAEGVGVVLEVARLRKIEVSKRTRFGLLAEVGEALSKTRDRDALCAEIARLAVPRLADLCVVAVIDADVLRIAGVAHSDPTTAARLAAAARDYRLGRAEEGGALTLAWRSRSVADLPDCGSALRDPASPEALLRLIAREATPRCAVAVPLLVAGEVAGVFLVGRGASGAPYGDRDHLILSEYAQRCATYLENAALSQQARGASDTLEGLVAVVAHDLTRIIGSLQAEVSAIATGEPSFGQEQSQRIGLQCNRARRLINDLISGAVLGDGRFDVDAVPAQLWPVIDEAVGMWAPVAQEGAIAIVVAPRRELPAVQMDRERVLSVLSRLIESALGFVTTNGTIHLLADQLGDEVRVGVMEDGCGIADEELPHVFDRSWKGRSGGIGLALSISKSIVEAHRGRLWVESKRPAGSAFYFTLPIAGAAPTVAG